MFKRPRPGEGLGPGVTINTSPAEQLCFAGDGDKGLWGAPGRLPEHQRRFPGIDYSEKSRRAWDESKRDPTCVEGKMILLAVGFTAAKSVPRGQGGGVCSWAPGRVLQSPQAPVWTTRKKGSGWWEVWNTSFLSGGLTG